MTLDKLKDKYKLGIGAQFEPKAGCKFCNGTGEKFVKKLNRSTFCICLYVDHEVSDLAGDTLAATAKKLKDEMK